MKANELRLGNLINTQNGVEEICTIYIGSFITETCSSFEYCEPIPLTEEWLLKFGFKKIGTNDFYDDLYHFGNGTHNGFYFSLSGVAVVGWNDYYDHHQEVGDCQYVHQLQNLYFALTGEELTIKD